MDLADLFNLLPITSFVSAYLELPHMRDLLVQILHKSGTTNRPSRLETIQGITIFIENIIL